VKRLAVIFLLFAGLCGPAWWLRGQTNLLVNSGFETNYYDISTNTIAFGWTNNAYLGASLWLTKETNNPHTGSNCQRVAASGLNATNSALVYQTFNFQAGHVYNASVWLRASTGSLVQFELRNVNNYYEAGASHILTVTSSWQQAVINGGWQNGSNAQFAVSFLSNGTNWIDDASLTDVTSNYLCAPLANTTSAVPATFFGMHINKTTAANNWPPLQQGIIRLWDTGTRWNQIETNDNVFTWTHFDACTNTILTNNPNCKLLYTLGQTPEWAALNTNTPKASDGTNGASSSPADMANWSNYVSAVATRYKGRIQYYEIWNETDAQNFYNGAISNMVTMAQIARVALTNVDPTIRVIGPNITLGGFGWLEQFILAGGPPPDIVSFHDYPTSRPEDCLPNIVGLRDMLSHYPQFSSLPIWCTEGAPDEGTNTEQNRGIASRAYVFWWTQNVQNWNWYAWDLTNVNNEFQVVLSVNPPSEAPTAAGIAYSNTANWLVGAQMVSLNIDSNGTWAAGLQRLGFTNAHIVWNPDATTNFSLPSSWDVFQMRDLSNNITSLTNVSSIQVDVAPVILDSVPSLTISNYDGEEVSVLWAAPASGYNLYSTTNLASASWLMSTGPSRTTNGVIQVPQPRTNNALFFRLSAP
jgi:hypothetical protein